MPGEEESSRLVKSFSTIFDEVGRKENEPDNEAKEEVPDEMKNLS